MVILDFYHWVKWASVFEVYYIQNILKLPQYSDTAMEIILFQTSTLVHRWISSASLSSKGTRVPTILNGSIFQVSSLLRLNILVKHPNVADHLNETFFSWDGKGSNKHSKTRFRAILEEDPPTKKSPDLEETFCRFPRDVQSHQVLPNKKTPWGSYVLSGTSTMSLQNVSSWSLPHGCFQKKWYPYPQIIHFNRVFHFKPSILVYPYFWKQSHSNTNLQINLPNLLLQGVRFHKRSLHQ